MDYHQLFNNIKKKNSFLCVGLDTDINRIPKFMLEKKDPLFDFNKEIIDATSPYAMAYKPNMAFYESLGSKGWISLEKTVEYIRTEYPDLFVIADAKRGDIGNTAKMYASTFFDTMNFDAITISPYMGEDSVTPYLEYQDKWIIILALTSNNGAFDFQYIRERESNKYLFENILEKSLKWGDKENIMYVVGATQAEMLMQVRQIVPNHFLLVPGIGAQGGSLEEVAQYGMNKKCGLIVNASRSIIYADSSENFAEAAAEEARGMQKKMQKLLESYKVL